MPRSSAPDRSSPARDVRLIRDVDWYQHPQWYDILHAEGTAREVRGLERLARKHLAWKGEQPLTLFEPACGTARHLRYAAARGHHVIGLDLSQPMLDYARAAFERKGLSAHLALADMTDFDATTLGLRGNRHVDLAFCPINSIRHLDSDAALLAHLQCVARVLAPRSLYAVGIGLTDYDIEQPSEDIWHGSRGSCRITQVAQYLPGERGTPDERIERVISHLTITTPKHTTHVDHAYTLRRYNADQWRGILRRANLDVVALVDEDGRPFRDPNDPWAMGYAVYLLRPRPGTTARIG